LGAAWFEEEHRELGIEFPPTGERFDLLEDALGGLTRLLTGEPVSFDGTYLELVDAQLRPPPVQRPHPPIWIGGSGRRRTLPIAAEYADMWHSFGTPDNLRPLSIYLDRLAEEAGRDPTSIGRAASLSLSQPLDDIRRTAASWREAGFDYLVCGWPSEGRSRVEEFASRLIAGDA
jgi:alkanesulfonate monooxygenase SsuD/methylene tetrahydromethanopterin reductase-like flavin-dependent oxidoreductase (luciferase family)